MSMQVNYPLRFEPICKERIWGGHRLESVLGKQLPPDKQIGESWEICDHGQDVSIVANGPLRGRTLRDLLSESGSHLLGEALAAQRSRQATSPQFPLLVKWIDAHENLSIQVHPPDGHPLLPSGENGKTECWLVVAAEPGAEIYLGLRRGIDRPTFVRELARGIVRYCLNVFPARAGDFFFVPAGTPHAIGAGILLAEIQQSSDTTFRLFDWNRLDPATGRPRELQIEQALASIDFQAAPPVTRRVPDASGPNSTTLLSGDQCPYFTVDWRRVTTTETVGDSARGTALVCLAGAAKLNGGGESMDLGAGDCVLLPAMGRFDCEPATSVEFLEARIAR
jgi:mannose-6-phosphate isomerase